MQLHRRKTIVASLALCALLMAFSVAFFIFDLNFEQIKFMAHTLPFGPKLFDPKGARGAWAPSDEDVLNVMRDGTNVEEAIQFTPWTIKAAFEPKDKTFTRLSCPEPSAERYGYLRRTPDSDEKPKYFFALDLYNNHLILPRLLGSIIDACRFLGPESCAISALEGRSTDGTYEILKLLESPMQRIGIQYFLNTSDLDPGREEWHYRIETLSHLRNLALQPLSDHPEQFHEDAVVLFLNDAAFCVDDILELVHQRIVQGADMTCGMDWGLRNNNPTFYDVWVSRGITGDSFFYIPSDGSWDHAQDLFWNDEKSKSRLAQYKPFQVFDCWNGGVVFTSRALKAGIRFRAHAKEECYQGEPQLWGKDMWYHGMGRIAVVPSVNVAYNSFDAMRVKFVKGYTWEHVRKEHEGLNMTIDWQLQPPAEVRCIVNWGEQYWVPWNESLPLSSYNEAVVEAGKNETRRA